MHPFLNQGWIQEKKIIHGKNVRKKICRTKVAEQASHGWDQYSSIKLE